MCTQKLQKGQKIFRKLENGQKKRIHTLEIELLLRGITTNTYGAHSLNEDFCFFDCEIPREKVRN